MQSALLQVASHLTDFSWSPQGMMGIVRQLSATFVEGEQTWWRTGRAVWCPETPTDACQDSVSWGSLWNWRKEDHTRWKYFYLPKHIDCEGNTHLSEWKYCMQQCKTTVRLWKANVLHYYQVTTDLYLHVSPANTWWIYLGKCKQLSIYKNRNVNSLFVFQC